MHAKQESITKILELTQRNAELSRQLREWEDWYYTGGSWNFSMVGEDYAARLKAIAPVIFEKVDAAVHGRHPCVPTTMRVRRNVAEHRFDGSFLKMASSEAGLKRAQRGNRRRIFLEEGDHEVGVWELLRDSADFACGVSNAGGSIVAGPDIEEFEGISLVNAAIAKREVSDDICHQVKIAIRRAKALPPHILGVGDIVWYHNDAIPSWVVRIGHTDYAGHVRIRSFLEPDTLAAGTWVCHTQCHLLERGDTLIATADLIDASERRRRIATGSRCRYIGKDTDGDVILRVQSAIDGKNRLVIFQEDLIRMTLH